MNLTEEQRFWVRSLKIVSSYLSMSIVALPIMDKLWLGELPVLALIQVPKAWLANQIQHEMVIKWIPWLGLSRGSYSPDSSLARPWALAVAYLVPIGIVIGILFWRTRMRPPVGKWTLIFVTLSAIDFVMMLLLAGGPGFSIY